MSDLRAFPRLSDGAALVCLRAVKLQAQRDPGELARLVAYEHSEAAPVATGAAIATPDEIRQLRSDVMESLARWPTGRQVPKGERGDFDRALGHALHTCLKVIPADAAHNATWNFLSAVVFPDLVWARYPELHETRFLGDKQRNTLRRVWRRQDVLGDLMMITGDAALMEDELVGLLERSALARNRRLVREVAALVMSRSGERRRDKWAREFYKRLTHLTGPLLLDVLDDGEIESLVIDVANGGSWAHDARTVPRRRADPYEHGHQHAAAPDLVRSFHEAMLRLSDDLCQLSESVGLGLRTLVQEEGGLSAALKVAGSDHPGAVFRAAMEEGRTGLTVEELVLSDEYRGLFGADLLAVAEGRLLSSSS